MKKLTAIFLLLALLCGIVGYQFYYSFRLQEVKNAAQKEIHSGHSEDSFIKICFDDNKLAIKKIITPPPEFVYKPKLNYV